MKSAVNTPPEFKVKNNKNRRVIIPSMIFVIQNEHLELLHYVEALENRLKQYIDVARAEGKGGRVSELTYFCNRIPALRSICDGKSSHEEASQAFNWMLERANLHFAQFKVDRNVTRVVETDYLLDDLKALHFKAAQHGIDL